MQRHLYGGMVDDAENQLGIKAQSEHKSNDRNEREALS
jgi:hypothetical protein